MTRLAPGDLAPPRQVPCSLGSPLDLGALAGRRAVICFFGGPHDPEGLAALAGLAAAAVDWRDQRVVALGVAAEAGARDDPTLASLADRVTLLWDDEGTLAGAMGMVAGAGRARGSLVFDENRRLVTFVPLVDGTGHAQAVAEALGTLTDWRGGHIRHRVAPVLLIPAVFDQDLCVRLAALYAAGAPAATPVAGVWQSWRAVPVADAALKAEIRDRVRERVWPEIHKAFHFQATHIEGYALVGYEGAEAGRFGPHRDDATPQTAHRRFSLAVDLGQACDGGEARFPEYGPDGYRPDPGAALVHSSALMHEILPVRAGCRVLFESHLHDADAEARRQKGS